MVFVKKLYGTKAYLIKEENSKVDEKQIL